MQRLIRLEESDDGLKVVIRWKGLPASEDTLESLHRVYEAVTELLNKLLDRNQTVASFVRKARRTLGLTDDRV